MRKISFAILTFIILFFSISPLQKVNATKTPLKCDSICIVKTLPIENDILDNKKPLIQVEYKLFSYEQNLDISKSFLKINGEKVDFKSTNSTIFYEIPEGIQGLVEVEAKVSTTDGGEDSKTWKFTIADNSVKTPEFTTQRTFFGLPSNIFNFIPLFAICLSSIFLFGILGIGLFLYFRKR